MKIGKIDIYSENLRVKVWMPLLKFYKLDTFQKLFSRLKVLARVFEVSWTFALRIEHIFINLEVFRAFLVTLTFSLRIENIFTNLEVIRAFQVTDGRFCLNFNFGCISEVFIRVFSEKG